MISHRNTRNKIWKKRYGFYLNMKLSSSLPLKPGRHYAVVLCNDSRVNLLVLFLTVWNSVKGPCDIKSLKILTASAVWFSRYQPSNMKLATDSALVIVFIDILWAVYTLQLGVTFVSQKHGGFSFSMWRTALLLCFNSTFLNFLDRKHTTCATRLKTNDYCVHPCAKVMALFFRTWISMS